MYCMYMKDHSKHESYQESKNNQIHKLLLEKYLKCPILLHNFYLAVIKMQKYPFMIFLSCRHCTFQPRRHILRMDLRLMSIHQLDMSSRIGSIYINFQYLEQKGRPLMSLLVQYLSNHRQCLNNSLCSQMNLLNSRKTDSYLGLNL